MCSEQFILSQSHTAPRTVLGLSRFKTEVSAELVPIKTVHLRDCLWLRWSSPLRMAAAFTKTLAGGIAGGTIGGGISLVAYEIGMRRSVDPTGTLLERERLDKLAAAAATTGVVTGIYQGFISAAWHQIVDWAIVRGRKPVKSLLYLGWKGAPPLVAAFCVLLEAGVTISSFLDDENDVRGVMQEDLMHAAASALYFGKHTVSPQNDICLTCAPRSDIHTVVQAHSGLLNFSFYERYVLHKHLGDLAVGFFAYALVPPWARALRSAAIAANMEQKAYAHATTTVLQSQDWTAREAHTTRQEVDNAKSQHEGAGGGSGLSEASLQPLNDIRVQRLHAKVASGDTELIEHQRQLWRIALDCLLPPSIFTVFGDAPMDMEGPDLAHMTETDLVAFRARLAQRGPAGAHAPHNPQPGLVWMRHPTGFVAMELGLVWARLLLQKEAKRRLGDNDTTPNMSGPVTSSSELLRLALHLTSDGPRLDAEELVGDCMLLARAMPDFAATGLCKPARDGAGRWMQGGLVLVRTADGVGFDPELMAVLLHGMANLVIKGQGDVEELRKVLAGDENARQAVEALQLWADAHGPDVVPSLASERARAIDLSTGLHIVLIDRPDIDVTSLRLVVGAGTEAGVGSDPSTWVIDPTRQPKPYVMPPAGEEDGGDAGAPLSWSESALERALEAVPSAEEVVGGRSRA